MENIIELKVNDWVDDYCILYNMMNDEDGIKEIFGNRIDRIQNTEISWLIRINDKYIGFVNLVCEKANHDYLFLDMGIIKAYRGKGIGKKAIEKVKKIIEGKNLKQYILMETKKTNVGANKAVEGIGCYLTEFGDRNVYLLQNERYQEFVDYNHMEKLANHYSEEDNKKSLMKAYYK